MEASLVLDYTCGFADLTMFLGLEEIPGRSS